MPLSNVTKSGTIDFWFRNQLPQQPSSVFVALYSTDPTGANTGVEITGGGYTRMGITFGAPTISGTQSIAQNNTVVTFPQLNANVGTAMFIALLDAQSGGRLLAYAALPVSLLLNAGFQPFIAQGDLRILAT
jgi:hypothetical protein